ncbi:DUF4160 domain-containing protein [Desulfonema magnum]|uniref:DUF4160 n=1 Tax=Desulfonema magnum TaxID=45655 RepID=A0A975BK79_9BACT|nr:DUF4160 domain-containing protein [Desulfonema magnum]QTA87031.1 DUF4160 [Desulfonema magnum]
MPTVLKIGPFRFHFYSDEGNEPPHIHVATPDGECKFWLEPVRIARNKGIAPHNLRRIEKLVFQNLNLLREKYNEFHNL